MFESRQGEFRVMFSFCVVKGIDLEFPLKKTYKISRCLVFQTNMVKPTNLIIETGV